MVGRALSPVIVERLHLSFLHTYTQLQINRPTPRLPPLPLHASPAHSCCHHHLSDRAPDTDQHTGSLENMPRGASSARKDADAQDAATPQEYP